MKFGKSWEKYIPRDALDVSPSQLRILLDALVLGDGSTCWNCPQGQVVYSTSSRHLADNIQEILSKLENGSKINTIKPHKVKLPNGRYCTSRTMYTITIPKRKYAFVGKKNIKTIQYNGMVYCVCVPNHLIIIRRNDTVSVTGNSCNFCANHLLCDGKVRYRNINKVVEDMEYYREKYGLNEFDFRDETFTMNRQRVIDLCAQLAGRDFKWHCQTRASLVDKQLLKSMKLAGCQSIGVGVESGNEQILTKIPKLMTKNQIRTGVKLIKEANIKVSAGFIIGHPWDTPATVKETMEFADELDVNTAGFALATPYPGTKLREQAQEKGEITATGWEDYYTTKPTYTPPGLAGQDLRKLRRDAEVYFNSKKWTRMFNRAKMHWPSFLLLLPRMLWKKIFYYI